MASASDKTAKSSGITTTAEGSFVPSSTRADGSVRKEIRVRPGYRPPEDVEVYKNRTADAWRNRGKRDGGVPGAEFVSEKDGRKANAGKKSGGKGKSADTKSKSEKTATSEAALVQESEKQTNGSTNIAPPTETTAADPEAEKEKEARKLNKKLRQARDLKQKKDEGSTLLPEQLEKVIKINELIRQLDNLGFDVDGRRKDAAGAEEEADEATGD